MTDLLVATTNRGKLREIAQILAGLPLRLRTLDEFPDIGIASETGVTFEENARQKAFYYAQGSGLTTLGEDSGFEVDALGGEPGVYSARYLGEDATYPDRFNDLNRRVAETGNGDRRARFVCAVALVHDGHVVFESRGTVEGLLAEHPAGPNGFGYDPILFYPPYGRTFGEVSDEEKTAVSHRGQAIRALREFLAGRLHPAGHGRHRYELLLD